MRIRGTHSAAHTRSGCRGVCAHVGAVSWQIVQRPRKTLAVSMAEVEAGARLRRRERDVERPCVRVERCMRLAQGEEAMRYAL